MKEHTEKKILEYIEENPIKVDWDGGEDWDAAAKSILEKGFDVYCQELLEMNLEYISILERGYAECLHEQDFPEEDFDEIEDLVVHNVCVDIVGNMLDRIGNINVVLWANSNYDCCNSIDNPDESSGTYLSEVYKRVRTGVRKSDYRNEFYNGAYGGARFCFLLSIPVKEFLWILDGIYEKKYSRIRIGKGAAFGFHSDWQGASTLFEARTHRTMTLPLVGESKYDNWAFEPEVVMSCSIADVYGQYLDVPEVELTLLK